MHFCNLAYFLVFSLCAVPNPPGPLQVESQTTDSINVSWSSPTLSEYSVKFTVSYLNLTQSTEKKWFLLEKLESGTLYNISVVTVGPLDYQSTMVSTCISTSKRTCKHPQSKLYITITFVNCN